MPKPPRLRTDVALEERQNKDIAALKRRRIGAGPFVPLVPNEGFLADDVDCGYYIASGMVHFRGGLYWATPAGYTPEGYGIEAPENDAINLFGTVDAFGGSTYEHHLLPAEARPTVATLYIDCHAIEGDAGLSGIVRYETRVGIDGGWTVTRAFSGGGTAYPVDEQGYTHLAGVPYNNFIMLEGVSWRVSDD